MGPVRSQGPVFQLIVKMRVFGRNLFALDRFHLLGSEFLKAKHMTVAPFEALIFVDREWSLQLIVTGSANALSVSFSKFSTSSADDTRMMGSFVDSIYTSLWPIAPTFSPCECHRRVGTCTWGAMHAIACGFLRQFSQAQEDC
jgi:hypothetical protein